MLLETLEMNFWRAPIDNDFGAWKIDKRPHDSIYFEFRKAASSYELRQLDTEKTKSGGFRLKYLFDHPLLNATNQITYIVQPDGSLDVECSLQPEDPDKLKYIPRYGMRLAIADEYQNVNYYGRGPFENYEDRNTAAFMGDYSAVVSDFYVPYIRPQENGYRTDVKDLKFQNNNGDGIQFMAWDKIGFSAHNIPQEDFDPGSLKAQRHTIDIQPKDKVWIHIDFKQTGVGGDNSWSKEGLANDEYKIDPTKCKFGFTISSITK